MQFFISSCSVSWQHFASHIRASLAQISLGHVAVAHHLGLNKRLVPGTLSAGHINSDALCRGSTQLQSSSPLWLPLAPSCGAFYYASRADETLLCRWWIPLLRPDSRFRHPDSMAAAAANWKIVQVQMQFAAMKLPATWPQTTGDGKPDDGRSQVQELLGPATQCIWHCNLILWSAGTNASAFADVVNWRRWILRLWIVVPLNGKSKAVSPYPRIPQILIRSHSHSHSHYHSQSRVLPLGLLLSLALFRLCVLSCPVLSCAVLCRPVLSHTLVLQLCSPVRVIYAPRCAVLYVYTYELYTRCVCMYVCVSVCVCVWARTPPLGW